LTDVSVVIHRHIKEALFEIRLVEREQKYWHRFLLGDAPYSCRTASCVLRNALMMLRLGFFKTFVVIAGPLLLDSKPARVAMYSTNPTAQLS